MKGTIWPADKKSAHWLLKVIVYFDRSNGCRFDTAIRLSLYNRSANI
jgi:hypothetical protein